MPSASQTGKAAAEDWNTGQKTVTLAGDAEILMDASTRTRIVTIKALVSNTGYIYVGIDTVSSSTGFELAAGDTITLEVDHSQKNIYIDSSVNGEGVSFEYEV